MPRKSLKTLSLTVLCGLLFACSGGESNVVQGNRDGILHYDNSAEPQGG
jgi:oligopeptide transport system substrate-binding protein